MIEALKADTSNSPLGALTIPPMCVELGAVHAVRHKNPGGALGVWAGLAAAKVATLSEAAPTCMSPKDRSHMAA